MIAGISEGLFASLHPQISKQGGMGLDGIALIIVIGGIDELKTQVVPNGLEDGLTDGENEHIGL